MEPVDGEYIEGFLQATHMVLLTFHQQFFQRGLDRWITINPGPGPGPRSMNSIHNGMLLEPTIHIKFDRFELSVNPDVGQAGSMVKTLIWPTVYQGQLQSHHFHPFELQEPFRPQPGS